MPNNDDILTTALEEYDLFDQKVLAAGCSRDTAREIIDLNPQHLTCVCVPGDDQKVKDVFNELGGERRDAEVIAADLSEPNLFDRSSFDFILAEYLINEIDIFAPRNHIDILQFLYDYLKLDGDMVVIDIEPDLPPSHFAESADGKLETLIKVSDAPVRDMNETARYRFYRRTRKLLTDVALNNGIPGFKEIPGDWVEKWLIGIGFKDVTPQLVTRTKTIEVLSEYEKQVRSFLERIEDEKMRKYIEALMDRSEALLREVCPFEYQEDIYIISARK